MITIRKAGINDHGELAQLYQDVRLESFHWQDTETMSRHDFVKDTVDEVITVAIIDDRIVGFISVFEPEGFVHLLFIATDHQGQGIGRQLIQSVQSDLDMDLSLKCVSSNHNALTAYEKMGWVRKEEHESQNYVLMSLRRD